MKSRDRLSLISGCAALVLLFCVIVICVRIDRTKDVRFFEQTLRDSAIREEVTYQGSVYQIESGLVLDSDGNSPDTDSRFHVLRLAYAKTLAKRSPLMALPGVDIEQFRNSVAALERLQSGIAGVQKTERKRALVETSLYPLRFLRSLADAEEARRTFISKSDEAGMIAYEKALGEAFRAYREDTFRYRYAFEELVPNTPKLFAIGESLTSFDRIVATLDALSLSHEKIRDEWLHRRICLSGTVATCNTARLALPFPESRGTRAVSDQEFRLSHDIIYVYKRLIDAPARFTPSIPVFALTESSCVQESIAPLYTVNTATSSIENIAFRKVIFVGDIRFIPSDNLRDVPFYEYFNTRGIRYIPTSPLLHYVCHDFDLDLARVLTVDSVRNLASSTPLSAYAEHDTKKTLMSLERGLTYNRMSPLRESDAAAYLTLARELFQSGAFPAALDEPVLSRILESAYGTAGYADALTGMIEIDTANARILDKGVPVDLEASYAFFFRSPVQFLFLAHNPSVHDPSVPLPLYFDTSTRESPYVYYSELPRTVEMRERIIRDMRVYREVHVQDASAPLESAFDI